jgi:hypothetical protein
MSRASSQSASVHPMPMATGACGARPNALTAHWGVSASRHENRVDVAGSRDGCRLRARGSPRP